MEPALVRQSPALKRGGVVSLRLAEARKNRIRHELRMNATTVEIPAGFMFVSRRNDSLSRRSAVSPRFALILRDFPWLRIASIDEERAKRVAGCCWQRIWSSAVTGVGEAARQDRVSTQDTGESVNTGIRLGEA